MITGRFKQRILRFLNITKQLYYFARQGLQSDCDAVQRSLIKRRLLKVKSPDQAPADRVIAHG